MSVEQFAIKGSPEYVLKTANGQYKELVIMGYTKDDGLQYMCSDGLSAAEANLLADYFKQMLTQVEYD